MKRKLILLYGIIVILISTILLIASRALLMIFLILNVLFIFSVICFIILNILIKKTNLYKNIFAYTTQFVSNASYRDNLQRNYEIVNLGSNPARFAFFYENVKGQNWSTGSQGLVEDLEILKYYFSYIKKGGVVLIPIVPFSSISAYLRFKPEYTPITYCAKFVKILDRHQIQQSLFLKKASRFLRYPLFSYPKAIRYLFKDTDKDTRLAVSEQTMQPLELYKDADKWIDGWKKEFNIHNLAKPLSEFNQKSFQESVENLKAIINFCIERDLQPVLVIPPLTKYLTNLFSPDVREKYIHSFIRQANTQGIRFLDYFDDERFQDPQYYFNSFFLNLRGRKLFTAQVLLDLGIS